MRLTETEKDAIRTYLSGDPMGVEALRHAVGGVSGISVLSQTMTPEQRDRVDHLIGVALRRRRYARLAREYRAMINAMRPDYV